MSFFIPSPSHVLLPFSSNKYYKYVYHFFIKINTPFVPIYLWADYHFYDNKQRTVNRISRSNW